MAKSNNVSNVRGIRSPLIHRRTIASSSNLPHLRTRETNMFKAPNFEKIPTRKTNIQRQSFMNSTKSQIAPKRLNTTMTSKPLCTTNMLPFKYLRTTQFFPRSYCPRQHPNIVQRMVKLAESLKDKKAPEAPKVVSVLISKTKPMTPRIPSWARSPRSSNKMDKDFQNLIIAGPPSAKKPANKPSPDKQKIVGHALSEPNLNDTHLSTAGTNLNITQHLKIQELEIDTNSHLDNTAKPNNDHHCRVSQTQKHYQLYHAKTNALKNSLKSLDNSFECVLRSEVENQLYEKFCNYQAQKETLYRDMKLLEEKLEENVKKELNVQLNFFNYIKEKDNFLEKKVSLHKEFEEAITNALEKCFSNIINHDSLCLSKMVRPNNEKAKTVAVKKLLSSVKSISPLPSPRVLRRSARISSTPKQYTPVSSRTRTSKISEKKKLSNTQQIKNSIYKDLQKSFQFCSPDCSIEKSKNTSSIKREFGKKIKRQIDLLFDD